MNTLHTALDKWLAKAPPRVEKVEPPKTIHKIFTGTDIKSGEASGVTVVCSNATVDRYGDIIEQNWALDNFRKNPVLLFAHESRSLPVGRVSQIGVQGGQLIAQLEFPTAET